MGGHATAADNITTAEALRQADALLWVIGLDANGEISFDDLQYLQNYADHIPLAVVVNKADQRPPTQVNAVMEQIRETLDDYGVEYCSISAYSSINGQEHQYIGQSLEDFLGKYNQQSLQRDLRMRDEVLNVLDDYLHAFDKEIDHRSKHRRELHSLKLDLSELGLFDELEEKETIVNHKNSQIDKNSEIAKFVDLLGLIASVDLTSGSHSIDHTRRNRVKDNALERLQYFSELFAIEKIEEHKREATRLRKDVESLFDEEW